MLDSFVLTMEKSKEEKREKEQPSPFLSDNVNIVQYY